MPVLNVKNLRVHYEKVEAVRDVTLEVEEGTIVTLIGANGAGKTTVLRAITGLKSPTSGEIWFKGQRIDKRPTSRIIREGIAHIPEGRRLFPRMSVIDNLMTGAHLRHDRPGIKADVEEMFVHFPILKQRMRQRAGTLSGGEQQMLAIARGLMSRPDLVLLDEPSLGLSPLMTQEIAEIIAEINRRGKSIVLVEQNAAIALELAHKCYVLETGRIALEGEASQLKDNEHVRKAYLGA